MTFLALPKVRPQKLSLRSLLILAFVLQTLATVGVTGWLSWRNGQKAVQSLEMELSDRVTHSIEQYIQTYFSDSNHTSAFLSGVIQSGAIDLNNLVEVQHFFWHQLRNRKDLHYMFFINTKGQIVGVEQTNENETILKVSGWRTPDWQFERLQNFARNVEFVEHRLPDGRTRDSFIAGSRAGKPTWVPIHLSVDRGLLETDSVTPIYSQDRKFLGVVGIELTLPQIARYLQQLPISRTGEAFIVDRQGLIIASSTDELPYDDQLPPERLLAIKSREPLIRNTMTQLLQRQPLDQIQTDQHFSYTTNGQRHLVQLRPFSDQRGLDFLIAVVIPEADFMETINANTRTTLFLCLLALALSTAFGCLAAAWLSQQIRRLSRASQQFARQAQQGFISGNAKFQPLPLPIQEFDDLVQSFNHMSEQLQHSFTQISTTNRTLAQTNQELAQSNSTLEQTNESLEQRVQARTAELQNAKEIADAANHAKGEFLANMSHDLQTPLNAILGYAQVLKRTTELTPKQQEGLQIIHQCGAYLSSLINDILDFAKAEANKLTLEPKNFHLEQLLLSVQDICRVQAEQKGIELHLHILNQLPTLVYGDDKRLRQVLLNLLWNAVKFTQQGEVSLKVGRMLINEQMVDPDSAAWDSNSPTKTIYTLRFQVEDTGVGMSPEQIDRIFSPFEQVGDGSMRAEGTGLGLAISRTLVEMMGGKIKVKSQPEQGSIFWFSLELPAVSSNGAMLNPSLLQPADPPRTIQGYEGEPRRILVVDDHWENRAVLLNILQPLGFQVIEASNGQQGLSKAHTEHPDAILTDLAMPTMDGLEMTRALRQTGGNQVPIIASSAFVFEYDQQQSRDAGCNDFLPKPIQADDLLDLLQRHLGLVWIF